MSENERQFSEGEDLNDLEEEVQENIEELSKNLLKAAANGEIDRVEALLKKKPNIHYTDKKCWTPLMWASAQGYEQIVKLLLEAGAASIFKQPQMQDADEDSKIKFTPLHWASFNGHTRVVWVLLKNGFSPLDLDMFGNTCIHQAAAAGRRDILETFLAFGVNIDQKNNRGHQPLSLATEHSVRELIHQAMSTKKCTECSVEFDLYVERHLCQLCDRYFCGKCCILSWIYDSIMSEEPEKPVCRCKDCEKRLKDTENSLEDSIMSNNFERVNSTISTIESENVEVDIKLLQRAKREHERLRTEGEIYAFLKTFAYVEHYKTIQKSVYVLGQMIEDAEKRDVVLDDRLKETAKQESERLISERNLRHQVAITPAFNATQEGVQVLEKLISIAAKNGVAQEYIDSAKELSEKMQRNINAHYILRLFLDYPMREYPEPEVVDPRKRGAKAPPKPATPDPKKAAPKKKKKEPKFIVPDWAEETPSLQAQVEALDKLIKEAAVLELNEDFLAQAKENLIRMRKEIRFRNQQEEEAKAEAEKKKAEARKNKK
jgi:hypothetical protein